LPRCGTLRTRIVIPDDARGWQVVNLGPDRYGRRLANGGFELGMRRPTKSTRTIDRATLIE
jgi:hypothetical protein